MNIAKALGVVLLVSVLNPLAPAQSNDRVQQTWKGPDVSTLWELLKDTGAKNARVDVLMFKLSGDSGVTKALADAIGETPDERAALVQAFAQLNRATKQKLRGRGSQTILRRQ